MRNTIAIDFGTSNSTVSYFADGGPQLIPLEGDNLTIPSAIFFNLEEDKIQFGREAIAAYTSHYPGRLLRSLKSILGSSLIEESTQIGYEQIAFKDIIGSFLAHLKSVAERRLQCEVDDVILGRPVWFVDDDEEKDLLAQNQLEDIARTCGFGRVNFQYEPIAAALDYESRVNNEELALIADIGGGTSDFSIVIVSSQNHLKHDRRDDILANAGVHVGGTDFDKQLSLAQVMPHLGYKTHQRDRPSLELPSSVYFDLATWHRIALLYGKKTISLLGEIRLVAAYPDLVDRLIRVVREMTGHQLAGDVERAKIALSSETELCVPFPYVDDGLQISFTREAFDEATRREADKISACIQECIAMAGVDPGEIGTLFLTGGTSGIPAVRRCCTAAVPHAKLIEGDRFGSVGAGLAIDAWIRRSEQLAPHKTKNE